MQIKQIQASADPVQDRLLLRIATSGNEEVRVHVTRRFLRELWPHLVAMLFGHLGRPLPAAGSAAGAAPGTFGQPYANPDPTLPLGATPLLPGEAKLVPAGDGRCSLTLREPRERSFTLTLDADLLQALCAMLRAAAEQAGWNLALPYGSPAPTDAEPAPTGRQLLH